MQIESSNCVVDGHPSAGHKETSGRHPHIFSSGTNMRPFNDPAHLSTCHSGAADQHPLDSVDDPSGASIDPDARRMIRRIDPPLIWRRRTAAATSASLCPAAPPLASDFPAKKMNSLHVVLTWLVVISYSSVDGAQAAESSTLRPANFVPLIEEATVKPTPEVYRAVDERGQVCTMASLEATVVLWPAGDGTREIRIEMPDQVTASSSGKCLTADEQNRPLLVVTWSTFQLCFYISKNGQNWTIDQVVFVFNSSELAAASNSVKSEIKKFTSGRTVANELTAPMGFSYRCIATKQLALSPLDGSRDNGTLILSSFQLQPFLQDKTNFGNETACPEDNKMQVRRRNDAITIAVGSTLAVISVVTVFGYALFRYFKVKAIGYGTME